MTWIIPAIFSPLAFTAVNFIDKYVLEKEISDYKGMPIFVGITGLVIGTVFWFLAGMPILVVRDLLLLLSAGMLSVWGGVLYFNAMSAEEASKVILLLQTLPVMLLVLSYFLLGERITATQLIGFVAILASVIGASDTSAKGFKITHAFWLIVGVNFMWATAAMLIKFTVDQNSFLDILSFESWGIGLGAIVLFIVSKEIRMAFLYNIRTVGKRILVIMFFNEGVFVISKASTFLAYSLGPAALVSVVGSTSIFYGIFIGLFLTVFFPKLIKEDISSRVLIKKIMYAIIMFVGIVLVTK